MQRKVWGRKGMTGEQVQMVVKCRGMSGMCWHGSHRVREVRGGWKTRENSGKARTMSENVANEWNSEIK